MTARQMVLVGFLQAQNCSNYPASWRHPESAADFLTPAYYQRIARVLEDGKFHLAFFDDRLAMPDRYGNDFRESVRNGVRVVKMDPIPILATMGAATPVTIEGGEMKATDEKVVSYMRQEMRATAEARGRNGDLAAAMVDRDLKVPGLSDKGKLLTLDGQQALQWKVASFEAIDLHQLIDKLGYGPGSGKTYTIDRVSWSWAETLAGWLSGSVLAGLLMTIGMLGIMIGLYTGGNPVPLAVGGVCLALFFFGHHIVALVGMEEIILFALGAGLVAFEIFVPGHILPGVIGVLLILGSLVMGLVDVHTVPLSIQWEEGWITRALATVFGSILATAVLAYAAFRVLPESRYFRRFMLPGSIDSRATDRVSAGIREVVGEVGIAVTHLRPAGTVKIRGRRYDAVAERGYIDQGESVTVIRAQGFSVVGTQTRAPAAGPEEDA